MAWAGFIAVVGAVALAALAQASPPPGSDGLAESRAALPQNQTLDAAPQRPLTADDVVLNGGPKFPLETASFYPEAAQRHGVTGSADISCVISADQSLTACAVISEAPQGWEFGRATIRLYSHFTVDPVAKDGSQTVGRPIILHTNWKCCAHPTGPIHIWPNPH